MWWDECGQWWWGFPQLCMAALTSSVLEEAKSLNYIRCLDRKEKRGGQSSQPFWTPQEVQDSHWPQPDSHTNTHTAAVHTCRHSISKHWGSTVYTHKYAYCTWRQNNTLQQLTHGETHAHIPKITHRKKTCTNPFIMAIKHTKSSISLYRQRVRNTERTHSTLLLSTFQQGLNLWVHKTMLALMLILYRSVWPHPIPFNSWAGVM